VKQILNNILVILEPGEKKRFFLLSALDIIISIADVASLALLLWIVQFYIQPVQTHVPAFLPAWMSDSRSVALIAGFVVFFGIKNWTGYLISRAHFRFISTIAVRISRNKLFNYQHAGFAEFINTDTSVHIRNICLKPFDFAQYMLSGVQQIITQLSLIIVAIIAILLFNAKLFLLLLLILLPPVVLVFWFMKKKMTVAKKNIHEGNERSYRYVLDALKGYVESNVYDRNDFFLQRFVNSRRVFSTHLFDSLALQNLPGRIIEIFAVLGLFILILIANWYTGNDSATLITIGAFMAAAYKIIPGIVKIINIGGQIKAYEFSLQDLKENSAVAGPDAGTTEDIYSVELKNIGFQYDQQPVLKQFSMAIKKGEMVGISGESGRGKTTLLNLVLGFLQASEGELIINGKSMKHEEVKTHWPAVAYVRQQGFFIHDTLFRNITLEEFTQDEGRLRNAIAVSGLDKVLEKFPEGAGKVITENGRNISGGQQQRIAIARALYKDASLYLLDEPFNELDDEAVDALLQHFRQLAEGGKMILLVTHDKKALSYCHKTIALDAL